MPSLWHPSRPFNLIWPAHLRFSHRTLGPYRPVIHHQPLHRKVTEIAGREARSHSESGCCREAVGLT